MPFAYYKKLSSVQRKIYDASVSQPSIQLPAPLALRPLVAALQAALASASPSDTQAAAQAFANGLCDQLRVSRVKIKVLAKRPSSRSGELHGLYESQAGTFPVITVWMRTAKRIQVVAFKTFLRTLLHELIHHLDYAFLHLGDSFHTEGFYQRESSLLKQLI